jgi:hypothetical protein
MEIYIEIPKGHRDAEAFGANLQRLLAEDQIEDRVLGNAEIWASDRQSGVTELWKRALLPDGSRRLVIDTDADAEFHADPAVLDAAKSYGFRTLTVEQRVAHHGEPIEAFDYTIEFRDFASDGKGKPVVALLDGYSPGDRLSADIELKHTGPSKAYDLAKVEGLVIECLENLCDNTSAIMQQRLADLQSNAPAN